MGRRHVDGRGICCWKAPGRLSALSQTGGLTGQLLATGVFIVVTQLPKEALLSWGWRIPFLLSALLVLPGLYMRHRLDETPVFRAFKKQQAINHRQQREERPVVKVVREQWRSILLIIILRFAESVPFFLPPSSRFPGRRRSLGLPA